MKKVVIAALTAGFIAGGSSFTASANEFEPQIMDILNNQVKSWLADPAIVEAIKAQNDAHAGLSAADIDGLDQTWRAEAKAGGGDLVNKVLGKDVSKFLTSKKEASNGVFSEIFVMDNKGLNVGQSDVTSDYMQGDEGKWQKTYSAGPDAVFVDEVEFDDSSQTFQSQVSTTIVDPATGSPIGAITLGINVENL